jgi:hypothetical protein
MATYTVTAPDGKEYDVDAPEGATQEQALDYFKSNWKPQAQAQPQPQPEEESSTLKDYARWAMPKAEQMAHAANMTRRAGIEGVAAIPGDIANLAAMPVNALLAKSKFKDNQIPDLGTQKYGEQLANQMGIAKTQPDEETAMMVGRNVIGGLAGSALTKLGRAPEMVQKMYGANAPIRSAVGIGAGTLGAEAGRELTQDSDSETARTLAPIAGGILANSMTQGISGAANIMSEGARAERAANALKQKVPDADLLDNPLTEYEHNLYSGVSPTAAMKYSNPAIAAAETNARLRNKDNFFNRDTENQRVLSNAITGKASADADTLFKQLNRTTSPMREEAYAKAQANGGFDDAVRAKIAALLANPDTRSSSTLPTIIKPIEKTLEREDLAPGDLYSKRKELADALKDAKKNPASNVELTNAVKNSEREAKQLKAAIDEGLDTASGGDWMRYINAHREGAKVPNEIQSWQKVARGFENKPEIAPGVPRIEAHPLRTNISKNTYSGERDLLSEEGRKEATSMVHTMNALERARSQRGATTGSQTMPLAMEVTKQLMPDKLKSLANLAGGVKDYWKGNTLLDDAILNPEKLPDLIELAIKNKDKTFLDAIRGNVARESTFNQGE